MGVRSEVRPGQWANAARALRVGALLQGVCVLLPPLDLAVLHTVRDHVRALLGKLDARSQLEAVVTAERLGLVALDPEGEPLAGGR